MKKKTFFFLLAFLILFTGIVSANTTNQDVSTPLPAQYLVRSWELTGDCLWFIAGQPWVYDDPTLWRHLYEANKNRMPQPDNPDLILIGMVLDIPSISGEIREGLWTDSGISNTRTTGIAASVSGNDTTVYAFPNTVYEPVSGSMIAEPVLENEVTDYAFVTGTADYLRETETIEGTLGIITIPEFDDIFQGISALNIPRDYYSALDDVVFDIPAPGQLQSNKYLSEGARLTALSHEAFEAGEYDDSILYSEEAIRYSQLSDLWVTLQLVVVEIITARNQALAAGAGYLAPEYFLEIDNVSLNALSQYESGNYVSALATSTQILEMYRSLTVGVMAFKLRIEIDENDLFRYDPENIAATDEIIFSALLDYEYGNTHSAILKANDALIRYTQSLNAAVVRESEEDLDRETLTNEPAPQLEYYLIGVR